MKYNKLIRDKIPAIMKKKGSLAKVHIAGELEYWKKLKEKLQEEIAEFDESEHIEELADIYEVLDAILLFKNFRREDVETIKKKKAEERGKFKKRIILEES